VLQEKERTYADLQSALTSRDNDLHQVRETTKLLADDVRKQLDHLREAARHESPKASLKSAKVWSAFEAGVNFYQTQCWGDAIRCFQECIQKDPRWGPGYQYLALAYHAQGDDVRAMATAQQALECDPANSELGAWVTRLRTSIDLKNRQAAS
jgi:tetratricopeptide (TPR) repeat protein